MKKIIICVVIIFFILCGGIVFFFLSPAVSYDKQLFLNNQNAYNTIAQVCISDFYETDNSAKIYTYSFASDMSSIFCYNNEKIIQLNKEQVTAATVVNNTFRLDQHNLGFLRVTDDKVVFGIENGRASFIYSNKDAKPNFVNFPSEKSGRIYVEKITDNWYFACKQD